MTPMNESMCGYSEVVWSQVLSRLFTGSQVGDRNLHQARPSELKISNNYRFLPGYGHSTYKQAIEDHAKMFFSDVTSCVLANIMKNLFPESHILPPKKRGFICGLVKRPQEPEHEDRNILSALEDIMMGKCNIKTAGSVHGVEESRLVEILVWKYNITPAFEKSSVNYGGESITNAIYYNYTNASSDSATSSNGFLDCQTISPEKRGFFCGLIRRPEVKGETAWERETKEHWRHFR
ncbi:hypothetical protein CAPTEDRAFT_215619 [Capitella teleta]|uniref:Uncharacterized protein n=1 Tax=Capitella teleta TaxID=283909 RepID=R7UXK3_CAPTE|nr:hypothetical protein CAPTEDRAFT_215619 [Capitella teleta]|eukprot:ELU11064.1 hypothetical protein CAPTEDRAFT_215619 [Capitella teleta]